MKEEKNKNKIKIIIIIFVISIIIFSIETYLSKETINLIGSISRVIIASGIQTIIFTPFVLFLDNKIIKELSYVLLFLELIAIIIGNSIH